MGGAAPESRGVLAGQRAVRSAEKRVRNSLRRNTLQMPPENRPTLLHAGRRRANARRPERHTHRNGSRRAGKISSANRRGRRRFIRRLCRGRSAPRQRAGRRAERRPRIGMSFAAPSRNAFTQGRNSITAASQFSLTRKVAGRKVFFVRENCTCKISQMSTIIRSSRGERSAAHRPQPG